jgi:hypothetical protein
LPEHAAIDVGQRGFRVELDGLVVVGKRPVVVALVGKCCGAVVVGDDVLAVELDDLTKSAMARSRLPLRRQARPRPVKAVVRLGSSLSAWS